MWKMICTKYKNVPEICKKKLFIHFLICQSNKTQYNVIYYIGPRGKNSETQ